MKAYAVDLRERIVTAVETGLTHAAVATTFAVSRSSVTRYLRQHRQTGSLAPRPIPGRPAVKSSALADGLVAQLRASPAATITEHCQQWHSATGQAVSPATMRRAIHAAEWTFKKRP
jgi:transposase